MTAMLILQAPRSTIRHAGVPTTPFDELRETLATLYRDHAELFAGGYMRVHGRPKCVDNQVRTFRWYEPYLPADGRVLDWGCNHAPDSCLLRAAHGDRFELHGCDLWPEEAYPAFYRFAGLDYKRLDGPVRLPYSSEQFDVVIGSGVLEHAAMDYESLKELYRVLRPEGLFIGTYLPNRLSTMEWWRRTVLGRDFHRRLYGRAETSGLLKRTGFVPLTVTHHTFFWERMLGRAAGPLGGLLRRLLPVHHFCSTFRFIARKQLCM
jgi:SAM-dependent methyltransferase